MSEALRVHLRIFEGPSLSASFPAVVAEFRSPVAEPLAPDQAEDGLRRFLPARVRAALTLPLRDGAFDSIAAAVAVALQDFRGVNDLPIQVEREPDGRSRLVLGYIDPDATALAVSLALKVTEAFFKFTAGEPIQGAELAAQIQAATQKIHALQPDVLARALIALARRRGVPVYMVSPGSRIWLYGQGRAGTHFFEAGTEKDSFTGTLLARNKFVSNLLVQRLGFPGVKHCHVANLEMAKQVARAMGFPVVVKPNSSGKGHGVTPYILSEKGLDVAFATARGENGDTVLVERHVMGDEHRFVVVGGRLGWVVRRTPPRVTGDGRHSVRELIDIENQQRAARIVVGADSTSLPFDDEVIGVLASQGLTADSRPAVGMVVALLYVSNMSRGGTPTDCTADTHPDNRDLAESIARSFRLENAGIDFMTPDITRSWREVECAVLEVNSTPGFSSDERTQIVFQATFPPGTTGRIPSVVLIGAGEDALKRVAAVLRARGLRTGCTNGTHSDLDGQARAKPKTALPERVRALLLDPGCEALVIAASPRELEMHGFPLDRCDLALIMAGANLSGPLASLVESCTTALHPKLELADFEPASLSARLAAIPTR